MSEFYISWPFSASDNIVGVQIVAEEDYSGHQINSMQSNPSSKNTEFEAVQISSVIDNQENDLFEEKATAFKYLTSTTNSGMQYHIRIQSTQGVIDLNRNDDCNPSSVTLEDPLISHTIKVLKKNNHGTMEEVLIEQALFDGSNEDFHSTISDFSLAIWAIEIILLARLFASTSESSDEEQHPSVLSLSQLLSLGNFHIMQSWSTKERDESYIGVRNPIEYFAQLGCFLVKLCENPLLLGDDVLQAMQYVDQAVQGFDHMIIDTGCYYNSSSSALSHNPNDSNDEKKAQMLQDLELLWDNDQMTTEKDQQLWETMRQMIRQQCSLTVLRHYCLECFAFTSWSMQVNHDHGNNLCYAVADNAYADPNSVVECIPQQKWFAASSEIENVQPNEPSNEKVEEDVANEKEKEEEELYWNEHENDDLIDFYGNNKGETQLKRSRESSSSSFPLSQKKRKKVFTSSGTTKLLAAERFRWLESQGKWCWSDAEIASGKDLSQVKKKYKHVMCTYCAEFASHTTWAILQARQYTIPLFVAHDKSREHRRACELRRQYVIDDENEEDEDEEHYQEESDWISVCNSSDEDEKEEKEVRKKVTKKSSSSSVHSTPISSSSKSHKKQYHQQRGEEEETELIVTPVKLNEIDFSEHRLKNIAQSRVLTLYQFHCTIKRQDNDLKLHSDHYHLKYIQTRGSKGFLNVVNKYYKIQKAFSSLSTLIFVAEIILLALQPVYMLEGLLTIGNYHAVQSFATLILSKAQEVDEEKENEKSPFPHQAHVLFTNPMEYYLQLGWSLAYFQQNPMVFVGLLLSNMEDDANREEVERLQELLNKAIKSYEALKIDVVELLNQYHNSRSNNSSSAAELVSRNPLKNVWQKLAVICESSLLQESVSSLDKLAITVTSLFGVELKKQALPLPDDDLHEEIGKMLLFPIGFPPDCCDIFLTTVKKQA